jgi:hypothetical protein
LIDIFLQFWTAEQLRLIHKRGLHEHFIDLQKGLIKKSKDLGLSKKALAQKLETVFVFLKATIDNPDKIKITHWDVRDICKIIQDDKANYALIETFEKYKNIRKVPIETLVDNLDKATDIKKNKEDKAKPGKLIERAITALNGIDRKNKHYKTDVDVKTKIKTLDALVKEMKNELGIK